MEGHCCLLTAVDHYTQWAEAIPVRGIPRLDCVEAFFRDSISLFSVPDDLTSDRGRSVSTDFCRWLGIRQHLVTTYVPSTGQLPHGKRSQAAHGGTQS
jgi:hypothetical protein